MKKMLGGLINTTTYSVAQKIATAMEPCENDREIEEVFRKAKEILKLKKEIWKLKKETVTQ